MPVAVILRALSILGRGRAMAGVAAGGKRFLVVEDDAVFSRVLTRGLRARGFEVSLATTASEALLAAREVLPDYIILDLKLGPESALPLIGPLRELSPEPRICLLTGFAGIATAIESIKLGAHHYLAKPAHIDEILVSLGIAIAPPSDRQAAHSTRTPVARQHSLDDVEWRHILKALRDCDGNISRAARALSMHRRTLQRKLAAHADDLARVRRMAGRRSASGGNCCDTIDCDS